MFEVFGIFYKIKNEKHMLFDEVYLKPLLFNSKNSAKKYAKKYYSSTDFFIENITISAGILKTYERE